MKKIKTSTVINIVMILLVVILTGAAVYVFVNKFVPKGQVLGEEDTQDATTTVDSSLGGTSTQDSLTSDASATSTSDSSATSTTDSTTTPDSNASGTTSSLSQNSSDQNSTNTPSSVGDNSNATSSVDSSDSGNSEDTANDNPTSTSPVDSSSAPVVTNQGDSTTTPEGLIITYAYPGTSTTTAQDGDAVTVSYTINISKGHGAVITPSATADEKTNTVTFTLGSQSVIQAFNLGIEGMRIGEVRYLVIPTTLINSLDGSEINKVPQDAVIKATIKLKEIN